MKPANTLLALSLFAAAGIVQAAPNCTLKLKGNDQMQFDLKTATVSAACPTINIELTHTGKMPAQAMGHNVVISASKDLPGVTAAGMKAGAAAGYVAKGDARVLAATPVAGGGATVRAKLAEVAALALARALALGFGEKISLESSLARGSLRAVVAGAGLKPRPCPGALDLGPQAGVEPLVEDRLQALHLVAEASLHADVSVRGKPLAHLRPERKRAPRSF